MKTYYYVFAVVIMMLGEPDAKTPMEFIYIFRKSCGLNKSADYFEIIFRFKSNSVLKVESEWHSFIG